MGLWYMVLEILFEVYCTPFWDAHRKIFIHQNFEQFLPAGIDVSLYLRPTNCTEVDNIVHRIKSSSAGGEKVNLKVIKYILPTILEDLWDWLTLTLKLAYSLVLLRQQMCLHYFREMRGLVRQIIDPFQFCLY